MSNMGYCRFQNTDDDLYDCVEALESGDPLSEEEYKAMLRMVNKCRKIVIMADNQELPQQESNFQDELDNDDHLW